MKRDRKSISENFSEVNSYTLEDLQKLFQNLYPQHEFNWKVKSKRIWGLCPFHEETKPSFNIYYNLQGIPAYHCFGCNKSGNILQLMYKSGKPLTKEEYAYLNLLELYNKFAKWSGQLLLESREAESIRDWLQKKIPGVIEWHKWVMENDYLPLIGFYPTVFEVKRWLRNQNVEESDMTKNLMPQNMQIFQHSLAYFYGLNPGQIGGIKLRQPLFEKDKKKLIEWLTGWDRRASKSLFGLSFFEEKLTRPIIVEGENDLLALQVLAYFDTGQKIESIAVGGVGNIKPELYQLLVSYGTDIAAIFPDNDKSGQSVILNHVKYCYKNNIAPVIIWPVDYKYEADPCDYCKEIKSIQVLFNQAKSIEDYLYELIKQESSKVSHLEGTHVIVRKTREILKGIPRDISRVVTRRLYKDTGIIVDVHTRTKRKHIYTASEAYYEWQNFMKNKKDIYVLGINFGYKRDLITIAGLTGIGKTTFCLNLALHLASNNIKVVYGTYELEPGYLSSKAWYIYCYMNKISPSHVDAVPLNDRYNKLISSNLLFTDEPDYREFKNTILEMKSKIDEEDKIVVFLDYVQFLPFIMSNESTNKRVAMENFITDLWQFVKENEITVVLISAFNREVLKKNLRVFKDPDDVRYDLLSCLKETSMIEYSSRQVYFLSFRNGDEYTLGKPKIPTNTYDVLLIQAKNTYSKVEDIYLVWHADKGLYELASETTNDPLKNVI